MWKVFQQKPNNLLKGHENGKKAFANWEKVVAKKGFVGPDSFAWDQSIRQGTRFEVDFHPPGWTSFNTYTGWVNDQGEPQGWGRVEYSWGYIYEGQWANGEKHGSGRRVGYDGEVWEGRFERGDHKGEEYRI